MYVQLCAGKFQILNWRHIVHMITLHTVRGEPNQIFWKLCFSICYFKLWLIFYWCVVGFMIWKQKRAMLNKMNDKIIFRFFCICSVLWDRKYLVWYNLEGIGWVCLSDWHLRCNCSQTVHTIVELHDGDDDWLSAFHYQPFTTTPKAQEYPDDCNVSLPCLPLSTRWPFLHFIF